MGRWRRIPSCRPMRCTCRRCRRLLQPNVDTAASVLEFLKAVFFHECQQAFDLSEVHSADLYTGHCLLIGFLWHLKFEKLAGRARQINGPFGGHHDIVLNANPTEPFDVNPGFHR